MLAFANLAAGRASTSKTLASSASSNQRCPARRPSSNRPSSSEWTGCRPCLPRRMRRPAQDRLCTLEMKLFACEKLKQASLHDGTKFIKSRLHTATEEGILATGPDAILEGFLRSLSLFGTCAAFLPKRVPLKPPSGSTK